VGREPIVFDFIMQKAYPASAPTPTADLLGKVKKKRVVKTVEGIPPQVLQPQK